MTSIFETWFGNVLHDQNCNVKISRTWKPPRNFILFKISKAILIMKSGIYLNSKMSNYGPYIKLLHVGPAKLEVQVCDKI